MLAATKLGAKVLVHNYGHGGDGVTLSWGTASLAVDLVRDFVQTRSSSRRTPEIDYAYLSSGYMFPRRDSIVLGGTWDHDDWNLQPDPEQAAWILDTHAEIMKHAKS